MRIDLLSFFFGVLLTLAVLIVVDRVYPFLGGGRRARQLARKVRELQNVIRRKDQLIRKSIEELKKERKVLADEES